MTDSSFFIFARSANRDLEKLDHKVRKAILKKLRWYANLDNPMDAAEPVKNEPPLTHRFRFGGWRVLGIWMQREKQFLVTEINRRGQAYKQRRR